MKDDRTYPALVLRWGDDFVCVRCGSRRWKAFIVYDNKKETFGPIFSDANVKQQKVWCDGCDYWTEIVAPEHKEGGES